MCWCQNLPIRMTMTSEGEATAVATKRQALVLRQNLKSKLRVVKHSRQDSKWREAAFPANIAPRHSQPATSWPGTWKRLTENTQPVSGFSGRFLKVMTLKKSSPVSSAQPFSWRSIVWTDTSWTSTRKSTTISVTSAQRPSTRQTSLSAMWCQFTIRFGDTCATNVIRPSRLPTNWELTTWSTTRTSKSFSVTNVPGLMGTNGTCSDMSWQCTRLLSSNVIVATEPFRSSACSTGTFFRSTRARKDTSVISAIRHSSLQETAKGTN